MPDKGQRILFEKFEIIDCLKKDDHAAVYLANHIYLSKKIILKVLNTQNLPDNSPLERFKREAKILAQVEHRHIIRVLDFGMYEHLFYISFEYFVSNNLRYYINENSFSDEQKIFLAIQLFKGLDYAHKNNIIHRDIKPENIFVSDSLELKIGDFGLALVINENFVTSQYSALGTPCYMSPEQAMGDKLTYRSDLFSAGIVLYELFTGTNIFLGKDVNETLNRIISFDEAKGLEIPVSVPDNIKLIIESLLRKDESKRLKNAEEVLKLLGADLEAMPDKVKQSKISDNLYEKGHYSILKEKKKTAYFMILGFIVLAVIFVYFNINKNNSTQVVVNNSQSSLPVTEVQKSILSVNNPVKNNENIKEEKKEAAKDVEKKPAAAVEKKYGRLFIECYPWADVFIDSTKVETTPLKNSIALPEGEYRLKLVNPNYPVYARKITIKQLQLTEMKIKLDTLFGYLDCKVFPWCEVYIDGKMRGQTPLQIPMRLLPGEHRIVLKNTNFNPVEFVVKIKRNQVFELKHNFKNLN
jgi:serine/threonine protein kinase